MGIKKNITKEFCIYVGGKPTEIDKFLYSEKVYSKRKAIKRAKQLRRLFNAPTILEEWNFTFVKLCSLQNGFTKGKTISFHVPKFKEVA